MQTRLRVRKWQWLITTFILIIFRMVYCTVYDIVISHSYALHEADNIVYISKFAEWPHDIHVGVSCDSYFFPALFHDPIVA